MAALSQNAHAVRDKSTPTHAASVPAVALLIRASQFPSVNVRQDLAGMALVALEYPHQFQYQNQLQHLSFLIYAPMEAEPYRKVSAAKDKSTLIHAALALVVALLIQVS